VIGLFVGFGLVFVGWCLIYYIFGWGWFFGVVVFWGVGVVGVWKVN
jgi:hypothetical protein